MRRVLPLLLLAAAVLSASAASATGTPITSERVGPFPFGETTPSGLQKALGKAERVWRFAGRGQIPKTDLTVGAGSAYGYDCGPKGCATVYGFKGTLLIGFWTRSPAFRTVKGTRVGTPLAAALRAERGERWSGVAVQCPAIDLSGTGPEFKADVARGRVTDFLITLSPQNFADGC